MTCSQCGVPIAEHSNTDACALAQEARAEGIDAALLTRVLWNGIGQARNWLDMGVTTAEFAAWIAAEYARLAGEA